MRRALLIAMFALACRSEREPPANSAEAELDRIVHDLEPMSDRLATVVEITDLTAAKREIDSLRSEHATLAARVAAIRESTAVSRPARDAAARLAAELESTRKLLDEISRDIPPTLEKP